MRLQTIRNSRVTKIVAGFLAFLLLDPIMGFNALKAGTGGPTQPEFSKYTAVGASDMVDPFTGNVGYSVPLFDIGGYPVTLSYSGDLHPEQDAGWVGLGWSLNLGSVNRALRGVPDDFRGDVISNEVKQLPHKTMKVALDQTNVELFTAEGGNKDEAYKYKSKKTKSVNMSFIYDNYTGWGVGFGLGSGKMRELTQWNLSHHLDSSVKDTTIWKDETKLKAIFIKLSNGFGGIWSTIASTTKKDTIIRLVRYTDSITGDLKSHSLFQMAGSVNYDSKSGIGATYSYNNSNNALLNFLGGIHLNYNTASGQLNTGTHLGYSNNSMNASYTPNFNYVPVLASPLNKFLQLNRSDLISFSPSKTNARKQITVQVSTGLTRLINSNQDLKSYGCLYADQGVSGENIQDVQDHGNYTDKYTKQLSTAAVTYDVFNISAAGIGGSFRLHQNSLVLQGPINTTKSIKNIGVYYKAEMAAEPEGGVDLGLTVTRDKYGPLSNSDFMNEKVVDGLSPAGDVVNSGYLQSELRNDFEFIETPADYENQFGGQKMISFKLKPKRRLRLHNQISNEIATMEESQFKSGLTNNKIVKSHRDAKQQIVTYLTAAEASISGKGFMTSISNYHFTTSGEPSVAYNTSKQQYQLQGVSQNRVLEDRKSHHISEFTVLQPDGSRYYFGTPVYNNFTEDYVFSVEGGSATDGKTNVYNKSNATTAYHSSDLTNNKKGIDNYVSKRTIPAYASTYLLNAILSPDYSDKTGDGPSEDDLGNYVKFNYSRISHSNPAIRMGFAGGFKWRSMADKNSNNKADLDRGVWADPLDDKGSFSYGEKELWYIHSVESKDQIALFYLGDRLDGCAVQDKDGALDQSKKLKYLKKVVVYSKNEFYQSGLSAVPLKTVYLEYSYDLCKNYTFNGGGNPNNYKHPITGSTSDFNRGGKLTLHKVWFTYGKVNVPLAHPYVFEYNTTNPDYEYKGMDRWGTSINRQSGDASNLDGVNHMDYPYSKQTNRTLADQAASAWMLSDITIPSGGKIQIDYQADDYAYVQDVQASQMVKIESISNKAALTPDDGLGNNYLYNTLEALDLTNLDARNISNLVFSPQRNYLIIKRPTGTSINDLIDKEEMLYYNVCVNLDDKSKSEKKYEPVTGFCEIEETGDIAGTSYSWIKMKKEVAGFWPVNAISRMAVQQGLQKTPWLFMPGSDNRHNSFSLKQFANTAFGMFEEGLKRIVNQYKWVQTKGMCCETDLNRSFVRLKSATGYKVGGGHRVKAVTMYDQWAGMTTNLEKEASYTTTYSYTTYDENLKKEISSGVASYEPFVGGDENSLKMPRGVKAKKWEKWLLGHPDESKKLKEFRKIGPQTIGFDLDPVGEEFYPSAIVGYSKIKVGTIYPHDVDPNTSAIVSKLKKHQTGYTVHEFYTAKDFPINTDRTLLEKRQTRITGPRYSKLYKRKDITTTSGSASSTKVRTDWGFDVAADLTYSTSSQGFNIETNDMHGKLKSMLVYTEDSEQPFSGTKYFYKTDAYGNLINTIDVIRENGAVNTVQAGVNTEPVIYGSKFTSTTHRISPDINGDFIKSPPVIISGMLGYNLQRQVAKTITITKHIRRSGLVDSVVTFDKGAVTSTKNLAWDAVTGQVLLTRMWNEHKDPVYALVKPAHWMYKGLSGAYNNIDVPIDITTSTGIGTDASGLLMEGDELIWRDKFDNPGRYWVLSKQGNQVTLVDKSGNLVPDLTSGGVYKLKVVRSGRRNIIGLAAETLKLMKDPVVTVSGARSISIDKDWVLGSAAITYDDKRQVYEKDDFCWSFNCQSEYDNGGTETNGSSYNRPYMTLGSECPNTAQYNPADNSIGLNTAQSYKTQWTDGYIVGEKYNPFVLGIRGVWKPFDGYQYNDVRTASNDRIQTQSGAYNPNNTYIRQDGRLKNFKEFWYYSGGLWNARTTQDTSNPWTWTQNISWLDEKGNPAQSINALYIPSSAILAYNDRKLPVASSNNSKINEIMFDGFEELSEMANINVLCGGNLTYSGTSNIFDFTNTFKQQVWHWPLAQALIGNENKITTSQSHTGWKSLQLGSGETVIRIQANKGTFNSANSFGNPFYLRKDDIIPHFATEPNRKYMISLWVKEQQANQFELKLANGSGTTNILQPVSGKTVIIDGWKKLTYTFTPTGSSISLIFKNNANFYPAGNTQKFCYIDDLRIHPVESSFVSYVYDYGTSRIMAVLDDNNFAALFQYNEEGALVRKNIETERGVLTVEESRNSMKR